jgi:hypothetical protein
MKSQKYWNYRRILGDGMDINLLCPTCNNVLSDKFSSNKCLAPIDGSIFLDMECKKCQKYIAIKLTTTIIDDDT